MKIETRIVAGGRSPEDQGGAVNPPVHHASTLIFPTLAALTEAGHGPHNYGRRGMQGVLALEEAICALDGAAGCRLTPSGLGACGLALQAVTRTGGHVLVSDSVYWPTRRFCDTVLKDRGVATTYYDPMAGAAIASLIRPETQAVYAESPGSNTFEILDLPAIAAAAHARDLPVLMDNTWATALFFNPFERGADIVIQAVTKYLGGHADVMMGAVSATAEWMPRVTRAHQIFGQTVGPDDAYLALRGLRTLAVRLRRHEETALTLARWFADRPEVERVLHPALPGTPGHDVWRRDFTGSSGLFSVVMKGGETSQYAAMLDGMRCFAMGWSWGGFESLLVPVDVTAGRTFARLKSDGPVLRVHAGLEAVEDLIADLDEGFGRFHAAVK